MATDISVDTRVVQLIAKNLKAPAVDLATSNRHRTAEQASLPPPVAASYDAIRRAMYASGVTTETAISQLATAVNAAASLLEAAEIKNGLGTVRPI